MWSPRFRGRTTGTGIRSRGGGRDVVAPVSGADDRTCLRAPAQPADVVAPVSGADDRSRRRTWCARAGCGRPGFGGGRQVVALGRDPVSGCGRPGFGGGRQFREDRGGVRGEDVVAPVSGADDRSCQRREAARRGCSRPDFGGRITGDFARTGRHVPMQPFRKSGADDERNGRAGRGRGSLEAGGSNGPEHRIGTRNGIDGRRRTSVR